MSETAERMDGPRLLTINTGSFSLRTALYRVDCCGGEKEARELAIEIERRGSPESVLRLKDGRGDTIKEERGDLPDHPAARLAMLNQLRGRGLDRHLAAVATGCARR